MSTPSAASGSRYVRATSISSGPDVTPASTKSTNRRAGAGRQGDVRSGGERVVVGHRCLGRLGADDADVTRSGGGDRASGRREDHLDHRDRVALARVAQHRGAGGVAGDHQGLDAALDEVVQAFERVLADLADRLGPVGLARGVSEIQDRLVRQLVEHRARDGQAAEAGVEDADGSVCHALQRKANDPSCAAPCEPRHIVSPISSRRA